MSSQTDAASIETPQPWWPALGVHLGLLVVCAGCVYTIQPSGLFSKRQWASFALVGLVLLIVAAVTRGRAAATRPGKLLLALGAATALYLAYDPLLETLPGLSAITTGVLGRLQPSLATIGVVVALLAWGVYRVACTGCAAPRPPFRLALLAATVLVVVTALIMQIALSSLYDLSGATSNLVLAFRVLQVAALLLVSIEMSGAPGVGALAHGYVGLSLLAAVARNLIA